MSTPNTFTVFGDPVSVLASADSTKDSFSIITQTCQPGGGPPPHLHHNEDEVFTALSGEFELFDGSSWHPLRPGEVRYSLRGNLHTFRNCGATAGTILIVVTPGGIEQYLRAISPLTMPQDIDQLLRISEPFGIVFPGLETPPPQPLASDRGADASSSL